MRVLFALATVCSLVTASATAETYSIPTESGASLGVSGLNKTKIITSCQGHPAKHSFAKSGDAMVFTIHHRDVGTCVIDAGKGYTRGRPWAERTEVQSQKFAQRKRYLFTANISMDPRFASAHETTVFQVHQWDQKRCKCGPYVMVMFDRRGVLMIKVLKADHSHHLFYTDVTRADFEGRWTEIAVDIDTSKSNPSAAIYVAGKQLVDTSLFVQKGGTVFSKFGIYRPGNKYAELPTDRVYAKDMLYRELPSGAPLAEFGADK